MEFTLIYLMVGFLIAVLVAAFSSDRQLQDEYVFALIVLAYPLALAFGALVLIGKTVVFVAKYA